MSLDGDRIPFFSSCKRCWSRLASRAITRMGGGRTSGTLTPKSIELARKTRRKSRANTLICGPESNGWCAAPSVFPRRSTCTIWSLGCSSIAMNLDEPYEIGSIPLRHLHTAYSHSCTGVSGLVLMEEDGPCARNATAHEAKAVLEVQYVQRLLWFPDVSICSDG